MNKKNFNENLENMVFKINKKQKLDWSTLEWVDKIVTEI